MGVQEAAHLVLSFAAVGALISSFEYLTRPQLLADHALANWVVGQTSRPWKMSRVSEATIGRAFRYPAILIIVALRLASALGVLLPIDFSSGVLAALLAVTSALLALRSPYGTDGADQLLLLIFIAYALTLVIPGDESFHWVLWFITGQACLAYFTAGVAKVASPVWRDGRALAGILGTSSYGMRSLGPQLRAYPGVFRALGWGVMALECSFPLVLTGVPVITVTVLISAGLFHLTAVFLMRLNTFFWAFVATYPAILYCVLR